MFRRIIENHRSRKNSGLNLCSGLCLLALTACDSSNLQPAGDPSDPTEELKSQTTEFDFQPNAEASADLKMPANADASSVVTSIRLQQVQRQLGLEHVYQNGAAGNSMIVETIGGGCGWLDYDRDGWPDLYLNQGGDPAANTMADQPTDELYRQVLELPQQRKLVKVTTQAGIDERLYSQGVAIADYDNDGWQDVYVTNLGRNTLWRNCGDGTFIEVSQFSRTDDPLWSTSAGWGDIDRDGDLDLYVCNYCDYDPQNPFPCKDRQGRDTLCNPAELPPVPDSCFMNQGDGTFTQESMQRGLAGPGNRSLGVAIGDFNNDRWPDIYVANDTTDNFLFINQSEGEFVDQATIRGCAVDRAGGPQGSMGIAVADYDGNGFLDLYVTHFFEESNTLYANFGDRGFRDVTAIADLHRPTLRYLGFGTAFADFDLNGSYELLVANGHVDHSPRAADPRMRPQLFSLGANGRWSEQSSDAGDYFERELMGRGVALADFDRDGDPDVAISNENDGTILLENRSPEQPVNSGNRWLTLTLVGVESNRQAIGSRVVVSRDGRTFVQEYCGGTSFAASHHGEFLFGLGKDDGEINLEVIWPNGRTQQWSVQSNQSLMLVEGQAEIYAN